MATKKAKPHIVEVFERDFHLIHHKMVKAKDHYVATHQKEVQQARKAVKATQKKLDSTRKQVARAAVAAKKSGTRSAENQLKKARAAASLIAKSLGEARDIMKDKEANLKAARPFHRKLAARAKALEAFEKDWARKMHAEATARKKSAAAARKKRAAARKKTAVKS